MSDYGGSKTPKENRDLWQTPPELFVALKAEFGFAIDAAASKENALCRNFITEEEDALLCNWKDRMTTPGYAWLNPPYSCPSGFIKKAAQENADNDVGVVMLLPSDISVQWFREAEKTAHEIRFITGGRISFISAETGKAVSGNPKGSMLVIWHPWPRTHCHLTTVERDLLMQYGKRILKLKSEAA